MNKRPTSISVIAWILIVMAGVSLISTSAMINNPVAEELMAKSSVPVTVQYVLSYIALAITFVSGIAMLKGLNWSRYLYVIWSFIGFTFSLATSPMKVALIPGFVIFLVIAFFLFSAKANAFFKSVKGDENA